MRRPNAPEAVVVAMLAVVVSSLFARPAAADESLLVGVTENSFLWRTQEAVPIARDLGLDAVRVTLPWAPGQTRLEPADADALARLVMAAAGLRIVVGVTGEASAAPTDAAARDAYCAYVRDLLERFPTINDIVIWNEANLSYFWIPQFNPDGSSAAPVAYEALLSRCWDVLHGARPAVNLITTTSPRGKDDPGAAAVISHSPGNFIAKMAAAYRASGRTQPLFDTVGHNPFGTSSAEPPGQTHLWPGQISEGDLDRLVQALDDGFRGTAQPVPGRCVGNPPHCVEIWYLEAGYQTVPSAAERTTYTGLENDAQAIPDGPGPSVPAGSVTQSSQLTDGVRLAYCQPYVGAFFNFLLWDEADLTRWQSGVLWADGKPKASFDALRSTIGEVHDRRVDCTSVGVGSSPASTSADPLVERLEWPPTTDFSSFNEIWEFAISVRMNAAFRATVYHAGLPARPLLKVAGSLGRGVPRVVRFPRRRLRPGSYRIQVLVTRKTSPHVGGIRKSPKLIVSG